MAQISKVLRSGEGGRLFFRCPGCEEAHMVMVGGGVGPRWTWDGPPEKPTFRPSVLVVYESWEPPAVHGKPIPPLQKKVTKTCHSFVTDGNIEFLNDTSHALRGKTVPLGEWPA